MRGRRALLLTIGAEHVEATTLDGAVTERKVRLPDRWVRGFAEAAVATAGMTLRAELDGVTAGRFLATISRTSDARPGWVVASGTGLRLTGSPSEHSVCLAGNHRLAELRPLLRGAKALRIYGPDHGGHPAASAWAVELDDARFTLTLSPQPSRGFSGEGGLLTGLGLGDELDQTLAALAASGLVGHDAAEGSFFERELPFDTSRPPRDNPRLVDAQRLIDEGALSDSGDIVVVTSGDHVHSVRTDPWSCTALVGPTRWQAWALQARPCGPNEPSMIDEKALERAIFADDIDALSALFTGVSEADRASSRTRRQGAAEARSLDYRGLGGFLGIQVAVAATCTSARAAVAELGHGQSWQDDPPRDARQRLILSARRASEEQLATRDVRWKLQLVELFTATDRRAADDLHYVRWGLVDQLLAQAGLSHGSTPDYAVRALARAHPRLSDSPTAQEALQQLPEAADLLLKSLRSARPDWISEHSQVSGMAERRELWPRAAAELMESGSLERAVFHRTILEELLVGGTRPRVAIAAAVPRPSGSEPG